MAATPARIPMQSLKYKVCSSCSNTLNRTGKNADFLLLLALYPKSTYLLISLHSPYADPRKVVDNFNCFFFLRVVVVEASLICEISAEHTSSHCCNKDGWWRTYPECRQILVVFNIQSVAFSSLFPVKDEESWLVLPHSSHSQFLS